MIKVAWDEIPDRLHNQSELLILINSLYDTARFDDIETMFWEFMKEFSTNVDDPDFPDIRAGNFEGRDRTVQINPADEALFQLLIQKSRSRR